MSAAKKKIEDQPLEGSDAPTERELKLSKGFEDPPLEELLPQPGRPEAPVGISLLEEAADAVHDLVQEAEGFPIPPTILNMEAEPVEALPLPEGFEDLALAPPADAPVPQPAPLPAAPKAQGKVPPQLPKTVNPTPDPLERSLLIQATPDTDEGGLLALDGVGVEGDSAQYEMSAALFELVACERAFDDVVEAGLHAIMKALSAHAGSVLELDHQREDFFFRASVGGAASIAQLKTFRVPLTKGIVGHVAESGQPLLLRDLSSDKMQMRAISLSVGFEAATCMAAPIIVGGQPYGVIEVFNKRDGSLFEERDLAVLEKGVRMLAKVLEVRFLMSELVRRVR